MRLRVHKFRRTLKSPGQYRICDGKKVTFKQGGLSYFWADCTCKKCLALKPK